MRHPDANFFHGSAWAKVLHDTYNFKPAYLLEPSALRPPSSVILDPASSASPPSSILHPPSSILPAPAPSLLAVMDVRSPLTGRRGVSLPFTDVCPPLATETMPIADLLRQLTRLGKERRWNYWECRGLKSLPPGVPPSVSFYGHVLDLAPGEKALFDAFKSSVRTALRKSEQAGVKVETSATLEALQTFYSLHCQTRRKHGLPPQPFRFFRNLHRHILSKGLGQVVIARIRQTPIAANVFLHTGKKAIYKYGASADSFQEFRASNLVMWHGIQSCARAGCESLHFGRTAMAAEGLRRFKLGWGCREERIDYLRYDLRQDACIPGADEAFAWQNSIMARMPLVLLRILGAALYPHIA